MNDLLAMTFAFLLPLGPAFVLYKLLPSTANVSGPFKGLNIQLGGAFAGYFVLTLMAFGYLASRPNPLMEEVWEVTGRVACQDSIDVARLRLLMMPPTQHTYPNGNFNVQVPAKRLNSGKFELPTLMIEYADHETVSINLNEEGFMYGQANRSLKKDNDNKKISLNEISLKRKSAYQPSSGAQQPQEVTPPVSEVQQ